MRRNEELKMKDLQMKMLQNKIVELEIDSHEKFMNYLQLRRLHRFKVWLAFTKRVTKGQVSRSNALKLEFMKDNHQKQKQRRIH